jgi:hypothetical protein
MDWFITIPAKEGSVFNTENESSLFLKIKLSRETQMRKTSQP